jgi:hypothetical protein
MHRLLQKMAVGAACVAVSMSISPAGSLADHMSHATYLRVTANEPFGTQGNPIFDGDNFPRIDFTNPDIIRAALGDYTLKVRFFDANRNEVQTATAPGRYGAWAEVHFPNGVTDTRHVTLFKTAAPYNAVQDPYRATLEFPAAFGLPKEVVARETWNVNDCFNEAMQEFSELNTNYAILIAALHDIAANPARWEGESYWSIDDAWWCGLENKLGVSLDYQKLVHLPDGYDQQLDKRWPLIVFLHGSDERGDDLDVLHNAGPESYLKQGHALPFIVVTPLCPANEGWSPTRVSLLVDGIEKQYRVDPKRIYLTGLSMGGFGTFDTAAEFPAKFAAIASASGGAPPGVAERIKTVPTWIFHGRRDTVVPPDYSIAIAERMKIVGADVKLTIFPNGGHGPWNNVYNTPALYDWFLQHALP